MAVLVVAGLLGSIGAAACGSTPHANGTGGGAACKNVATCGQPDASAVCLGGGCKSDAGSSYVPCNDGTGSANCCTKAVASGNACNTPDLQCWTRCANGTRSKFACSEGTWLAGKGLFPCGADAGTEADAAAELPACAWPSELDLPDASSRDACHAARVLLSCTYQDGAGQICLSDGAARCPGPDPFPGVPSSCRNQCGANEYVAACGGVGPGSIPNPPSGCRSEGAIPAGIAYYCCPCGK